VATTEESMPTAGTPIRCPSCGAMNRAAAQWCARCLERFAPAAQPARSGPPPPPPPPVEAGPSPEETGRQRGAFRVSGERISWTCSRCEAENPLDAAVCPVCGTTFADSVRPPEADLPARDPGTAMLFSLFFPGAGHAYLRQWGQAVARSVLSTWVMLVLIVALAQWGAPGSLLLSVVFGLAAFGLWAVGAHDAYRAAAGQEGLVILRGRAYLYVVLGLLMLLIVSVMISAMGGRPSP
jgi:Zn-finger in Ran binding protein and others